MKISQNSYLHEFCAQVSQIVFLADLTVFADTVVISRKTVKSGKNTFCDICALNSRRYEFCDLFTHTVRISRKMVRSHRNSICDTCVQISRSYEFFDIFAYIVVISSKTVKSASKIVFLADLTFFAAYYNSMSENVTKHKTPRLFCTNVTNRLIR